MPSLARIAAEPARPAPPTRWARLRAAVDARASWIPAIFVLAALADEIVSRSRVGPDFAVFHRAAARFVAGEPLYRLSDGHFCFKYAPAAAALLSPLAALPARAAEIAFNAASAVALLAFMRFAAGGPRAARGGRGRLSPVAPPGMGRRVDCRAPRRERVALRRRRWAARARRLAHAPRRDDRPAPLRPAEPERLGGRMQLRRDAGAAGRVPGGGRAPRRRRRGGDGGVRVERGPSRPRARPPARVHGRALPRRVPLTPRLASEPPGGPAAPPCRAGARARRVPALAAGRVPRRGGALDRGRQHDERPHPGAARRGGAHAGAVLRARRAGHRPPRDLWDGPGGAGHAGRSASEAAWLAALTRL